MTQLDRRSFLRRSGAVVGGVSAAGPLSALMASPALAGPRPNRFRRELQSPDNGGYGPLTPTPDLATGEVLLSLPAGFEYVSFGRTGEMGSDGYPTPSRHDGMAAFDGGGGLVKLVRNHERGYSPIPFEGTPAGERPEPLVGNGDYAYDRNSGGACTTATFDTAAFRMTDSYISINGTSVNCAGGTTPQGTWLTCEETTNGTQSTFSDVEDGPVNPDLVYEQDHGYVFEVPTEGVVTAPVPYRAMGRFSHEAIAIDPSSCIVYETEDNNPAGFYRYLPEDPANLGAGGRLQMLRVTRRPEFDTRTAQKVGRPLLVDWVDIDEPDPSYPTDFDDVDGSLVFVQGAAQGGATFARLEGCWFGDGSVYINSTSGGNAGLGQVWEYRPRGRERGTLTLIFESPNAGLLDSPDNITVSPRGGLVLCEDGDDEQYLRGLDLEGRIFDLALNQVSENVDQEFAGATYSPDGSILFCNIQTPGISFAIRGPWGRGDL